MRSIVDGKQVTCEPVDKDIYGRTVACCHVGKLDVAAEMVRSGLAVAYGDGGNLYAGIEATSKASNSGIWVWSTCLPLCPSARAARATADPHTAVRRQPRATGSAFYSCAAARAAGAAPMFRVQAGNNPNLDGDNDGIACEPYRGRR